MATDLGCSPTNRRIRQRRQNGNRMLALGRALRRSLGQPLLQLRELTMQVQTLVQSLHELAPGAHQVPLQFRIP